MRRLLIALAFVLLVAACATTAETTTTTTTAAATTTTAGATTTTAPPGFTVTSDDGTVTLFVPPEAMAEDPGITIERLDPADYPDDLAALADAPGSAVYVLAPDGPTFDAPVTLTRRIPMSEFGEVDDGAVPVVTLITTTPDHQGWSYLSDLSVIRDGDELVVSGTTTHFSMVAAAHDMVHLEVKLVEVEDRFATEVGVDLHLQSAFFGADGEPLAPPASFTAAPTDTGGTTLSGGILATMQCPSIGSILSDIAFEAEIDRLGETASLQLLVSPQIVSTDSIQMRIGVRQTVDCLDPDQALTGRAVQTTLQPDHPDGEVIVPNQDFGGGNSGAVVTIVLAGTNPLPSAERLLLGLIEDCDFSGTLSAGDFILPPVQTTVATPEGRTAVIPIYDLADYMVYAIDGSVFGDLSSVIDEPNGVPLLSGIPLIGSLFRGQGRFVSSMGVVGDAEGASIFPVTRAETPTTLDRELIIFITPKLLHPEA